MIYYTYAILLVQQSYLIIRIVISAGWILLFTLIADDFINISSYWFLSYFELAVSFCFYGFFLLFLFLISAETFHTSALLLSAFAYIFSSFEHFENHSQNRSLKSFLRCSLFNQMIFVILCIWFILIILWHY